MGYLAFRVLNGALSSPSSSSPRTSWSCQTTSCLRSFPSRTAQTSRFLIHPGFRGHATSLASWVRVVCQSSASGDRGVGAACQINDGTNRTRFIPGFPSVCPYVTSVGGTEGNSPEQAAYFSGSGFSELWPRPAWQDKAVQTWMDAHGSEFAQYYNHTGRAYPDVSAMALGHQIVNHGVIESTGGTRCVDGLLTAWVSMETDHGRLQCLNASLRRYHRPP